jgi:hypothetical protein
VNWAAGKGDGPITMAEIGSQLDQGMDRAVKVVAAISADA